MDANFQKIAQDTVEYMALMDSLLEEKNVKIAALEKQASEQKPSLVVEEIKVTVDTLIKRGLMKEAEREQAVATIIARPETCLQFLNKLAEAFSQPRSTPTALGQPVGAATKGTSGTQKRESDRMFEATFNHPMGT